MVEKEVHQRPTIVDVAKHAGVSTATVSRYLNGTGSVANDTSERIVAAIEKLGYVSHSAARALRSNKTYAIGFITREIIEPTLVPLVRGVEQRARQAAYQLVLASRRLPLEVGVSSAVANHHNVDGLLVYADSVPVEELAYLAKIGFPLVRVSYSTPTELALPSIMIENEDSTAQLVEHLITVHNRRRIGFLRGPEGSDDSLKREAGYRRALHACSLPVDEALIDFGGFDTKTAQATVEKWIARQVDFDAIFTGDDKAAVGVLEALTNAGIKVPQDVSVVGFDDDYMSAHLHIPLTTVRVPFQQLGEEAVNCLLELINGGTPQSRMLRTEVVYRRSCGCDAVSR